MDSLTQRLSGYRVSCEDCNLVLHAGRTTALGKEAEALAHFKRVTKLDDGVLAVAVIQAISEWKERSKQTWHISIAIEPLAAGFEDAVNQLTSRY